MKKESISMMEAVAHTKTQNLILKSCKTLSIIRKLNMNQIRIVNQRRMIVNQRRIVIQITILEELAISQESSAGQVMIIEMIN